MENNYIIDSKERLIIRTKNYIVSFQIYTLNDEITFIGQNNLFTLNAKDFGDKVEE